MVLAYLQADSNVLISIATVYNCLGFNINMIFS